MVSEPSIMFQMRKLMGHMFKELSYQGWDGGLSPSYWMLKPVLLTIILYHPFGSWNFHTKQQRWMDKSQVVEETKQNKTKRAITEELLLNTGQEPLGTFNLMRQLSLPFNWGLQRLRNLLQSTQSMVPNPHDNLNKGHLSNPWYLNRNADARYTSAHSCRQRLLLPPLE